MIKDEKVKDKTVRDIFCPNRYWELKKFGPRLYSAKRYDGEHRLYFSRYALERDFGNVVFPSDLIQ